MPSLLFVTLDVFTKSRFLGNPLAVVTVPKGGHVSNQQMQTITNEFNLSETVFLHESTSGGGDPEWQVRIFMVGRALPFAGHPTIGTACYALGTVIKASKGRFICNAGLIELQYDGSAKASIPHNVHIHREQAFTAQQVAELQSALSSSGDIAAVDIVSPVRSMTFVCVELSSVETLAKVAIPGKELTAKRDRGWDNGLLVSYFYVVTKQSDTGMEVRTRFINRTFEDPATGSAACALGSFLTLKHKLPRADFTITQGVEMGRKSDIGVTVTLKESMDAVERVELGGSAVKVMEGTIDYE